jgi:hypothetical protein
MTMARTSRFIEELRSTASAGEAAIVVGNTSDVFVAEEIPDGLRLPKLVATAHASAGRAAIIYSLGYGARPLTVPGSEPPRLQLPPRDASPADALA